MAKDIEKEIPKSILMLYEIQLELVMPGLAAQLKKRPGAFEAACKYWLDKTIDEVLKGLNISTTNV